MDTEIILLALRVISGIVLLLLLAAIFVILWRDYRHTVIDLEASRRIYGQLVALHEVDGGYVATGAQFPLVQLTSLGRSPTNTITLDDSFASSEHAIVALRNSQWWLEDRNSRNGTTLNEVMISQPVIVTDGDIIGIGSLRFRLELER
ncbi:MAG: FHA domain-containing protein [Anaerolineaceae bacterium]|nr:FHA domain-containing protein [Anaerolineaceae bacterium]